VAAVTRLFDRVSTFYDVTLLQAVVYRPAQDEIIAELRSRGASRVADVGCGTGILADRIESELDTGVVYGCDLSEGMLDVARSRSTRVTWLRCPSEILPLPDRSLDAVVSSHAFHFFDQPAALEEFHRVLRPGGFVAVAIINPHTPIGSRLVRMSTGRTARFPHEAAMRRLFLRAGFARIRQRRIRRPGLRMLSPDLLTVAERP
jgi:ubiquinone/menaquinone biosynthesis C-methylase UbiE